MYVNVDRRLLTILNGKLRSPSPLAVDKRAFHCVYNKIIRALYIYSSAHIVGPLNRAYLGLLNYMEYIIKGIQSRHTEKCSPHGTSTHFAAFHHRPRSNNST